MKVIVLVLAICPPFAQDPWSQFPPKHDIRLEFSTTRLGASQMTIIGTIWKSVTVASSTAQQPSIHSS